MKDKNIDIILIFVGFVVIFLTVIGLFYYENLTTSREVCNIIIEENRLVIENILQNKDNIKYFEMKGLEKKYIGTNKLIFCDGTCTYHFNNAGSYWLNNNKNDNCGCYVLERDKFILGAKNYKFDNYVTDDEFCQQQGYKYALNAFSKAYAEIENGYGIIECGNSYLDIHGKSSQLFFVKKIFLRGYILDVKKYINGGSHE